MYLVRIWQVDIDEIMSRAETQTEQETHTVTSQLLSSFKVVSLENLEEEWQHQQDLQTRRQELEAAAAAQAISDVQRTAVAQGDAANAARLERARSSARYSTDNPDKHPDEKPVGLEKDWAEIIPDEFRKQVALEEEQQKLLELHLGPRQRKQFKPVPHLLPFSCSYHFFENNKSSILENRS